MAVRMLNSSVHSSNEMRIVLKTSRPAITARVLCGDMSSEAIESPVRCMIVCVVPSLFLKRGGRGNNQPHISPIQIGEQQ